MVEITAFRWRANLVKDFFEKNNSPPMRGKTGDVIYVCIALYKVRQRYDCVSRDAFEAS